MPLDTNTVPSQSRSSRGGAQNIAPMATMTASSGVVTAADSSLRTNINRSSYSNSGLAPDLYVSFSRASCTLRKERRLPLAAADAAR